MRSVVAGVSSMNPVATPVRMDKWLWAVRLYKTRSLASQACNNGRIRIDGHPVKPSRSVRSGEIIQSAASGLTRTVRVLQPIERRVGASVVAQYLEDLTPKAEYERAREAARAGFIPRPKGAGRPTKRERRQMEDLADPGIPMEDFGSSREPASYPPP